ISLSKKLASLSMYSRLLFLMILPHLNAYGKLYGSPYYIRNEVVPLLEEYDECTIVACLREISGKTNLKWYEDDGLWYLHLTDWTEHRQLKREEIGPDDFPQSCFSEWTDLVQAAMTNGLPTDSGQAERNGVKWVEARGNRKDVSKIPECPHFIVSRNNALFVNGREDGRSYVSRNNSGRSPFQNRGALGEALIVSLSASSNQNKPISRQVITFLDEIEELTLKTGDTTIYPTYEGIMKSLKISKSTLSRNIRAALKHGLIEVVSETCGRGHKGRLKRLYAEEFSGKLPE
ncbi:MAG: helix-turn-helix transcriptional regulator, partial [Nitrospirae bacterium]|nr:helix-turn-helix transcriptional regulator [Nitrospirota bacterium]